MADQADNDGDGDIFVYRGGRAPQHITHVLIDRSLDEIEEDAFLHCRQLLTVDTHDGLRKIGKGAFFRCYSLRRINLKSVVEIEGGAFYSCVNLVDVEFGDRLETIGECAFYACSLRHLKLPSIVTIGSCAFMVCKYLTDIELSERLKTIGRSAFTGCKRLQRIAIPLERDLFVLDDYWQRYNQFVFCEELSTVDIVGGIHETLVSFHMESWRTEMLPEINRINQVLPDTGEREKTDAIRQWMGRVMDKMDHYKAEHYRYVKEGITLLELALWKAKLGEKEDCYAAEGKPKEAVDAEVSRGERRITCGADIVVKNVLPFLQLE